MRGHVCPWSAVLGAPKPPYRDLAIESKAIEAVPGQAAELRRIY